jgi:hypothetical protein
MQTKTFTNGKTRWSWGMAWDIWMDPHHAIYNLLSWCANNVINTDVSKLIKEQYAQYIDTQILITIYTIYLVVSPLFTMEIIKQFTNNSPLEHHIADMLKSWLYCL